MSKETAEIVSLSSLMSDQIGGKVEDREESDKDLKSAITGEPKKEDFMGLDTAKENAEAEKKEEEAVALKLEDAPVVELKEKAENEEVIELENKNEKIDADKSEFYKRSLKVMFGDSISHLVEENEEGEEVEVALENAVITEDYYNQIVQSKLAEIKEEASKDKISTKGVSSFAKDLVEIDRNNGDISELLKAKETYSDPLDNLDLGTEDGQVQACYLRMMAGGQDEDTARRLISSYKADGILEEKALTAETELKEAVAQQVVRAKAAAQAKADDRKVLMKDYKKDIKTSLDRYQLNDNVKNKVVILATKTDDDGKFELDKTYYQHRENPKDAADLALFLLDKEEFIKQVTNTAVADTKLGTARKLKMVSSGASNPTLVDNNVKKSGSGTISLESLK